jgi:lipoate-protein ligase A
VPLKRESFYQRFLQPPVNVYRRIGIPVEYKPVNDIVVGGRKISGTGVGEIGDCVVFVGNLILDFNYEMMSRVLKLPDEKFRHKVRTTMEDHLTTIRRELGEAETARWDARTLNGLLAEEFAAILPRLEPREKDTELLAKATELGATMETDAWLYEKGMQAPGRSVKIRAGVDVMHRVHKAPGGLIRADFGVKDGSYSGVTISGDFFCFPSDAVGRLESMLEGRLLAETPRVIEEFYAKGEVETPGVAVADWLAALSP